LPTSSSISSISILLLLLKKDFYIKNCFKKEKSKKKKKRKETFFGFGFDFDFEVEILWGLVDFFYLTKLLHEVQ